MPDTPQRKRESGAKRKRYRAETVAQHVRKAVALGDCYKAQLGEDIAGRLAHHAHRMAHHREAYEAELKRLRSAARDIGMELPQVPTSAWH